jgi:hypothetical protein
VLIRSFVLYSSGVGYIMAISIGCIRCSIAWSNGLDCCINTITENARHCSNIILLFRPYVPMSVDRSPTVLRRMHSKSPFSKLYPTVFD